jgi:hexosaminidase
MVARARRVSGVVRGAVVVTVCALLAGACSGGSGQADPPAARGTPSGSPAPSAATLVPARWKIVPVPVSMRAAPGGGFRLTESTRILTPPGSAEAARIGDHLAGLLRRSTGYPLPVSEPPADPAGTTGAIVLQLAPDPPPGTEGYRLEVTPDRVTLRAAGPTGLFRGVQTLRQLLPARVESPAAQPGPWEIPAGRVDDHARYGWRGAHLDVARHFFSVAEVKRYIDLISLYKVNVLHLHLTDDQGWRIAIKGWPRLTSHGGSTEVGGGRGGFYTQRDYAELVAYARNRYVTVVPEVDMPGHTNAALASYPELNCDGKAPPLYTGTKVGFSSLCVDKPVTYRFLDDVIEQLAALTPGPYLHVGGDEVQTLSQARYTAFVERVQQIVRAHGKRMLGWQEITAARLHPTSVAQYWNHNEGPSGVRQAAARGNRLVLSPADKTYLDMKYDPGSRVGLDWAGHIEVRESYSWDPGTLVGGVAERNVLGVEAALWGETITDIDDIEFLAFPRLAGIAELGWSPARALGWDGYRGRLAAQGPRWDAMRVDFHRSPQVPWPAP